MQKTYSNAITITNISKKYEIHHEKPTLVERFIKGKHETFWALKNISLSIQKGEKIGIIGPNGSGKTTLLKLISGVTTPTNGNISVNGKIVSLIDLEAGFHPDLTGIQNIFLNGLLIGMSSQEIKSRLSRIISYAGIRQFIDAPLFTYSQGMKLRLGFSVAIYSDPDILIIDENIGVGDQYFVKKSQQKIQELFREGKTIILVSHWLAFLKTNCTRILQIENGQLVADGGLSILDKYAKQLPS